MQPEKRCRKKSALAFGNVNLLKTLGRQCDELLHLDQKRMFEADVLWRGTSSNRFGKVQLIRVSLSFQATRLVHYILISRTLKRSGSSDHRPRPTSSQRQNNPAKYIASARWITSSRLSGAEKVQTRRSSRMPCRKTCK